MVNLSDKSCAMWFDGIERTSATVAAGPWLSNECRLRPTPIAHDYTLRNASASDVIQLPCRQPIGAARSS
jgi:hypothetical protein